MARARRGSHVPLIFIVAAVLAVIAVPVALVNRRPVHEGPATPTPGFDVVAREIRTIPQLAPGKKSALVRGLAGTLEHLYTTAFVPPRVDVDTPPSPEPTPATNVDALFTSKARGELRKHPDVFRTVDAVRVTSGQVTFGGIVTIERSKPVQALLEVSFAGTGSPEGSDSPQVKMRQTGTLLLTGTSRGWRVAGFNLNFGSESIEPTPTESP
jgi:hypothetical protein